MDFGEFVEQKQREWFEGSREWLFEEVRQWLLLSSKRLCWLVGGAGTGKSVASARLLATAGVREHVKAWHFCRHDNAAGSDVRVILQSWATMLKNNLEGFKEVSLDDEDEEAKEDDTLGRASLANGALNVQEMFKQLIADPLARMKCPFSSPCLIVLDALDQLPRGSVDDMLQLLVEEFDKLPSFVRLFVASRDETLISKKLARFERVKLEVDEIRNRADLRMYLAQVARCHVTLELGMADLETRLEREFNVAPFRLRGELRGLDETMRRCKDIHAAAVTKLEQPVGEAGAANNYRAICNHIREFKLNKIGGELKQSVTKMDQLFVDAEEAHEKLKCLLLANKEVDKLFDPGLKSIDSALRKTKTEYEGDASRLKDLVRFTALFSNCARMKLFVEGLCGGTEAAIPALPTMDQSEEVKASRACSGVVVLALKNKYSSPSVLGYRDLKLTLGVELANGRVHLCELQVNLEEMMAAARLTHELYEEVRAKVPEVCMRAGIKDVELFKAKLSKMLRSSVLETAVTELEQKAEGLFLYASLLARHLETMEHKVDFAALQGLPSGLSEIYEMDFGRIMLTSMPKQPGELKRHEEEQWLAYSRLISLVVAAREPLPVTLARELVGVGYEEMEQALSILFPVREGRFQVMHKSVVDWLQDSERKSLFVISKEAIHAAHRSLGQCFYRRCFAQPAQLSHLAQQQPENDFCVRHVVYHLCKAGLWDQVHAVVSSVEGWLQPRAQMSPLGVVLDLELAASFEGSPHRSTTRINWPF